MFSLDHARIDQTMNEIFQKGIISPSRSEWVSEPHMVKEDDGTYWFCVDFRKLNQVTIHDLDPLPRIDDLLDQLGCSRYFTFIDLAAEYWQILMDSRDAHKTTSRTRIGLFSFNRMPFDLSDAGNIFWEMANSIFVDLISDSTILVYLNDILIHTSTWPQHIQASQATLQQIQQHNLKLQWKKCRWGRTR